MIPLAQAEVTALAPYLAGPGAAVVALLAVLGGLYRLIVSYGLPLATRLGERHLAQIDELIKVQREESKAVTRTLASIDRRLARLEGLTDSGVLVGAPTIQSPDRST
jgi:hypothetical protein